MDNLRYCGDLVAVVSGEGGDGSISLFGTLSALHVATLVVHGATQWLNRSRLCLDFASSSSSFQLI